MTMNTAPHNATAAAWMLQRTKCTRCFNLPRPANRVPDDVRKVFFLNYPDLAKAWEIQND